jgi:hypothetical protein
MIGLRFLQHLELAGLQRDLQPDESYRIAKLCAATVAAEEERQVIHCLFVDTAKNIGRKTTQTSRRSLPSPTRRDHP